MPKVAETSVVAPIAAVSHEPLEALPRRGHIRALDGVRGIAILLVIIHHLAGSVTWEFQWESAITKACSFGWTGVDLFFVLSGFLITGILFDAKSKPHFFRNFYARRTVRIFPLYYLALVTLAIMMWAWPSAGFYPRESQFWLWIYATNLVIAIQGFGGFGIVEHFWSLAVEEQFYLVWPFVVLRFNHRTLVRIAVATIVLAPLLRVALVLMHDVPAAPYVFTPARLDGFGAGAFVALMLRYPGGLAQMRRFAWPVFIAGLATVATLVLWRHTTSHEDPYLVTAGCSALALAFGASLVLVLSAPQWDWILGRGVLPFFGKYSYGLYVWHPLLFIIILHTPWGRSFREQGNLTHALLALLAACLATAIATALSWNLVEKPFLKLKQRFE